MKFKNISRIITGVSFIVSCLGFLTLDQINSILPGKYKVLAPTIITIIAWLSSQLSEEKRVGLATNAVVDDGGSDEEGI